MATLLFGKVFFQNKFAGFLREEPGFGSSFVYDEAYLLQSNPPIAHAFPLQEERFIYQTELPPFFDNLVAEGWLEQMQSKLLGKRLSSRFELLLAFGQDCAGAVSIIDPNPVKLTKNLLDINDPKESALFTSRASLSGIQPKLTIIEKTGTFYPSTSHHLSTHIAKFPSNTHADLVANELLTTIAFKKLLPNENVVEMQLGTIDGFEQEALIIKRFDRVGESRIHFEEFNQLLEYPSNSKYYGSYKQMADFIDNTPNCLQTDKYHLYLRILAGILLGNTDMHLKNFAMFHTSNGLRLTPAYDQVAVALYGYKQMALAINDKENLSINTLESTDIISLGVEFGLNGMSIQMALDTLEQNYSSAKLAISHSNHGSKDLKQQMVRSIDDIWNKVFASTGRHSLPKQ